MTSECVGPKITHWKTDKNHTNRWISPLKNDRNLCPEIPGIDLYRLQKHDHQPTRRQSFVSNGFFLFFFTSILRTIGIYIYTINLRLESTE